jgi:hypothetical protein
MLEFAGIGQNIQEKEEKFVKNCSFGPAGIACDKHTHAGRSWMNELCDHG